MKKCIICGKVLTTVKHSYVQLANFHTGGKRRRVYSCQGCNDDGKFDTWINGLPDDGYRLPVTQSPEL